MTRTDEMSMLLNPMTNIIRKPLRPLTSVDARTEEDSDEEHTPSMEEADLDSQGHR